LNQERTRLWLTDFGLAREENGANLTRRGEFLGTVRYMSPEQLLAQRAKVDRRSDIWSLGVSLYEALTLDLPYAADTDEAYISAVAMKQPIPARDRSRAVPRDLETVLMKCMERDPERRYATAGELRADLMRYLEEQPVRARRAGPFLRTVRLLKRHRLTGVGIGLTTILAAGLFVVLFHQQRERSDLERIRWTLEQTIRTDSTPTVLQADWDKLQSRLRLSRETSVASQREHNYIIHTPSPRT
jgi:serine/threonine protein kinase